MQRRGHRASRSGRVTWKACRRRGVVDPDGAAVALGDPAAQGEADAERASPVAGARGRREVRGRAARPRRAAARAATHSSAARARRRARRRRRPRERVGHQVREQRVQLGGIARHDGSGSRVTSAPRASRSRGEVAQHARPPWPRRRRRGRAPRRRRAPVVAARRRARASRRRRPRRRAPAGRGPRPSSRGAAPGRRSRRSRPRRAAAAQVVRRGGGEVAEVAVRALQLAAVELQRALGAAGAVLGGALVGDVDADGDGVAELPGGAAHRGGGPGDRALVAAGGAPRGDVVGPGRGRVAQRVARPRATSARSTAGGPTASGRPAARSPSLAMRSTARFAVTTRPSASSTAIGVAAVSSTVCRKARSAASAPLGVAARA